MSNKYGITLTGESFLRNRNIDESEGGFFGRLWGFIVFSVMAVFMCLIVTALFTYSPTDSGFSHVSSADQVSNLLGQQGAWVADLLYLLLGWGSWVLLIGGFFFFVRGWKRLRGKPVSQTWIPFGYRILAFILLIIACCALFFLRFHSYSPWLPSTTGGALGSAIGTELLYWMSNFQATLLLIVFAAICSSIFFGFSWFTLAEKVGNAFERLVRHFNRRREDKEDALLGEVSLKARKMHLDKSKEEKSVFSTINTKPMVVENTMIVPQSSQNRHKIDFSPIDAKTVKPVATVEPQQTELLLEEPLRTTEGELGNQNVKENPDALVGPEPYDFQPPKVQKNPSAPFVLPDASLLAEPPYDRPGVSQAELQLTSQRIEHILNNYKIKAKVLSALTGPVITLFKVRPDEGVSSRKFISVATDLARGLGQTSVRVVEKINEIDCLGIEVPNSSNSIQTIYLKEIINSQLFKQSKSRLTMALGKDVGGEPMVIDLATAPHLLVAGSTGSGKSVGVNAMILSMLYKNTPRQLRLILVDPKEVEFAPYENIPHLLTPVITDMADAARALGWAVREMDRRYKLMKMTGVRKFEDFNRKVAECEAKGEPLKNPLAIEDELLDELPYIVIIIDELADLMMTFGKDVERLIMRLTQKARAAGMHVILATQRPSTDIVTPIIKTNCPSRISFQVANRFDSQTILGEPGAEQLLGRGDMFFMRPGAPFSRIHGAFVSDDEIYRVTDFLKSQQEPDYVEGVVDEPEEEKEEVPESSGVNSESNQLYDKAISIVVNDNKASISYLQRRLGIGYNKAANLIEQMERDGIVSAAGPTGKRQVLSTGGSSDYSEI